LKLNTSTHLAYCTNIHPAETWAETWNALKTHTLSVRNAVGSAKEPFAIGLRLSALAARELLSQNSAGQYQHILAFKHWLHENNCYIFTINGFPYGDFHGVRVKEKVYQPDWTTEDRLQYTSDLFLILAKLLPSGIDGSVSTLPGSFKAFHADEHTIFSKLYSMAEFIEETSHRYECDLHLGLEPEPLGHFENTAETIAFFNRFHHWAEKRQLDTRCIHKRIGVNYDTCHFAIEFEDCRNSLDALRAAGIRISKIHLSSALAFKPTDTSAIAVIRKFDEPTYLHQIITRNAKSTLTRYRDIPDFLASLDTPNTRLQAQLDARCHFHIPLYAKPTPPLASTQQHARDALKYLKDHPHFCTHFEIETYTWQVLPNTLQIPLEQQIAREYHWVLTQPS